jgi:hypothetical protein
MIRQFFNLNTEFNKIYTQDNRHIFIKFSKKSIACVRAFISNENFTWVYI